MPQKTRNQTPSAWVKSIVDTLLEYNSDVETLFNELGMDYSQLHEKEGYYLQDDITRLWARVVEITQNPLIGLKVGTHIHSTSFPTFTYSMMSCRNLKESCQRLMRYQEVLSDGFRFEFESLENEYYLSFDISPCQLAPSEQAMDAMLANFLSFIKWVTGQQISPSRATLKRQTPDDLSAFNVAFKCPIRFESEANLLFFSVEDMEFPLPTADETISKIHDAKANQIIKAFNYDDFSTQVRNKLIEHLPSGEPKQELIAQELNLSSSTLKRRLVSENTRFQTLLDQVREMLAEDYLKQDELSLTEITYLLGFSENSVFNRAFKRWKGITPRQWQNK